MIIGPGEFIKEEMEERNWSQEALAQLLGISPETVNNLLNDKEAITIEMAGLLSKSFGQGNCIRSINMQTVNYHSKPGYPVDELKTTVIWERLNNLNSYKAENMCNFIIHIAPYLSDIQKFFPLYTRHDCHHGFQVLGRMADILEPYLLQDGPEGLTEDELVCLIVSAYAHDIGMTIFEKGKERDNLLIEWELPANIKDIDERLTDKLRQTHAERGIKFLKSSEAGKFISQPLRGLIGDIMKGHNLLPCKLKEELPPEAAVGKKITEPRLLSIILCCADALEFSDTRVLDNAYEEALIRNDNSAAKSLLEMRKHKAIGDCIAIDDGFIFATGNFEDTNTLHTTHITLDQIEEWLKDYINLASDFTGRFKKNILRIKNHKITRNFYLPENMEYVPVAIKVDERQIRELFTSKNLWGSETITGVKEILQNSLDACRYRIHTSKEAEIYNPQIDIIVNIKAKELTVTDNGCGMSKDDITEFFLQMFKSKTNSRKFREDPSNKNFYPIARFGVGFWSVFTIADKAIVKTRTNNSENGYAFEVSINPVMRYLKLVEDINIPIGTSISLKLKNDIDISELLEQLTKKLISPPIPIYIKDKIGKILYQFPTALPKTRPEELFEFLNQEAINKGIKWFNDEKETENIEFRLGVAYSIIQNKIRCVISEKEPITSLIPSINKSPETTITSVCGLETNINDNFLIVPLNITKIGMVKINIKNPKDLEFSLYRKDLEENNRLKIIKSDIHTCMAECLKTFYKKVNILNNPEKISQIILDSRNGRSANLGHRISALYEFYQNYYKNMVPLHLWECQLNEYGISYKNVWLFIENFWSLKKPVIYIPKSLEQILRNILYFLNFMKSIINKNDKKYFLWPSQESSAIIDVANKAIVKTIKFPKDQYMKYIEIFPSNGYSEDKYHLFTISKARWAGSVSKIMFEYSSDSRPWMSFGQNRMFIDENHLLTEKLLDIYSKGNISECGKILSLMQINDEPSCKEIEKATGIKILE